MFSLQPPRHIPTLPDRVRAELTWSAKSSRRVATIHTKGLCVHFTDRPAGCTSISPGVEMRTRESSQPFRSESDAPRCSTRRDIIQDGHGWDGPGQPVAATAAALDRTERKMRMIQMGSKLSRRQVRRLRCR